MKTNNLIKVICLLFLFPLTCLASDQDSIILSLTNTDIQAVSESDGVIWIQLTPPASDKLQKITEESYGKVLNVDIDGMPILSAHIYATITSGVVQVNNPPADVQRRLERLMQIKK